MHTADKIFFLHLPKCAGSSLWSLLRAVVGNDNVLQIWNADLSNQFSAMSAAERDSYRVVGGHFSLDLYGECLDLSQYFCITTIRDPVRRIVSEYRHALREPKHSHHREISQLSLKEFVEWSANPITRLICGRPDAKAAAERVEEIFDKWVFVEDLDQLVAALCQKAGKPPLPVPRLNVGSGADYAVDVDAEVLAAILTHHEADVELYRLLSETRASRVVSSSLASGRAITALTASNTPAGPVFAVVTPSLNGGRYLDETIESVVGQAGNFSIRYHIQDGGSIDGTPDIVQRWQRRVANGEITLRCTDVQLTFDSWSDGGMYDAIARGFRRLAPLPEHLMTWINTDDRLAPGAMETVASAFHDLPEVELVGGRTALMDARGRDCGVGTLNVYARPSIAAGLHDGRHLPFIQQEGTFWRGRLWERVGGIDRSFKLAGDWDLWRRFSATTEYVTLDAVTGYHRHHPGQLTADVSSYHLEIDSHIAAYSGYARNPVGNGAIWLDRKQASSSGCYSASVAGRDPETGHWALRVCQDLPRPNSLLPIDGDWITIDGFDPLEGPFPDLGLKDQFRWTVSVPATFDVFSALSGRRAISLVIRSMIPHQELRVRIDGGTPERRVLQGDFPRAEIVTVSHNFNPGPSRVELCVDRQVKTSEGRQLGVILSAVQFNVDGPGNGLQ